MRLDGRMLRILWTKHVNNGKVIKKIETKRTIVHKTKNEEKISFKKFSSHTQLKTVILIGLIISKFLAILKRDVQSIVKWGPDWLLNLNAWKTELLFLIIRENTFYFPSECRRLTHFTPWNLRFQLTWVRKSTLNQTF